MFFNSNSLLMIFLGTHVFVHFSTFILFLQLQLKPWENPLWQALFIGCHIFTHFLIFMSFVQAYINGWCTPPPGHMFVPPMPIPAVPQQPPPPPGDDDDMQHAACQEARPPIRVRRFSPNRPSTPPPPIDPRANDPWQEVWELPENQAVQVPPPFNHMHMAPMWHRPETPPRNAAHMNGIDNDSIAEENMND